MDMNQVIENSEEVMETAAEAIAEADWTGTDVAAGFGAGVLAGVLLTKFVIAPVWGKIKTAIRNRPPKEIKVKTAKKGDKAPELFEDEETTPDETDTQDK